MRIAFCLALTLALTAPATAKPCSSGACGRRAFVVTRPVAVYRTAYPVMHIAPIVIHRGSLFHRAFGRFRIHCR